MKIRPRNLKAVVYGLFTYKGECLYVGCTVQPRQRQNQLKNKGRPRGLPKGGWQFRYLLKCPLKQAGAAEVAAIKFYKDQGQAKYNRTLAGHADRQQGTGIAVYYRERGMVFLSYGEAARYFDCEPYTISKAIRCNGGKLGPTITLEDVPELSWRPKEWTLSPAITRGE